MTQHHCCSSLDEVVIDVVRRQRNRVVHQLLTTTTLLVQLIALVVAVTPTSAFTILAVKAPRQYLQHIQHSQQKGQSLVSSLSSLSFFLPSTSSSRRLATNDNTNTNTNTKSQYIPPEAVQPKRDPKLPPYPKIGDMVLYYDLDGGKADGETKVGKLTYLQRSSSPTIIESTASEGWQAEVTEMDDLGEGYYTDYPSRKRRSLVTLRPLADVSPLVSSYVRTEDAYKIPFSSTNQKPLPSFPQYQITNYTGPASSLTPHSEATIARDRVTYSNLKFQLLKDATLAGLAGTAIAGLTNGIDVAVIYGAGAIAGVGYLFFLGVKTDTVGGAATKFGNSVANLRFVLPVGVLVGVALGNLAAGDGSPVAAGIGGGMFRLVSTEQFGAAMLGFLTYRIPLFLSQIAPAVGESAESLLPGSAGVALDLVRDAREKSAKTNKGRLDANTDELTTILVVSGPAGTGKTGLVRRLIEDDGREEGGRFVEPERLDRFEDPAVFDRLKMRGEVLALDGGEDGRYALTKDGIFNAAPNKTSGGGNGDDGGVLKRVVVVDADVALTRKLVQLDGARIIGVWVGLDTIDKFETRIQTEIDTGRMSVPEEETEETVIRTKIRDIVMDIEYGLVSGVFEFTILNDDFETSLVQLKEAAAYCFR